MGFIAMKRQLSRILLGLAAGFFLMPVDVLAQTSVKVYRIGVLDMELPDLSSPSQRAFYDELLSAVTSRARTLPSSAATQPISLIGCRRSPGSWLRCSLTLSLRRGRNLIAPLRMLRRRPR